ncbi:MAG: porin, partial [Casimicrobiaceae bacterium]
MANIQGEWSMNRILNAAAVVVLGVAASAPVQAQSSNITLYGRLNLSLEAVSGLAVDPNLPANAAPVNRTLFRVNSNLSRLGIRGSESLGGGLSAIFQIESTVQADISGGVLGSRETFVGLQGAWGTARAGFYILPYDDIGSLFQNIPTLRSGLMNMNSMWAQGSLSIDQGSFDARYGNSIRYDMPQLNGFTGSVALSAYDFSPGSGGGGTTYGTDAQAKRHAYIGSTAGFYTNGPFQGGIAYQFNQKARCLTCNDWAFTLAANWNFGVVKIAGGYERLDYGLDHTIYGDANLTRNYYAVSATVPIGPGELFTSIATSRNGTGPAGAKVGNLAAGPDTGATQWELSYTYAFSKRTLAWLGFTQTRNQDNAAYNFGSPNPYVVVNGANANGL